MLAKCITRARFSLNKVRIPQEKSTDGEKTNDSDFNWFEEVREWCNDLISGYTTLGKIFVRT
jgi:hypothetical protein